ncbi:MAG: hypothetical protein RBR09_12125 [Desulfobulbaceae bacterium]|nr:hypothetical protein [Desulfobulbaceae bacterium]MDY0351995.1 hypothetical protein [Desulfobulbaceae bacterium]
MGILKQHSDFPGPVTVINGAFPAEDLRYILRLDFSTGLNGDQPVQNRAAADDSEQYDQKEKNEQFSDKAQHRTKNLSDN